MSSNPDQKRPETLAELVPIVADVIEHAQTLQGEADKAVRRVDSAAAVVAGTVNTLVANQKQMAADIEEVVAGKFNATVDGAADRIGQQLANAEGKAKTALTNLTTETNSAVTAVKLEADRLKQNWWLPVIIGAVVGALLGAAISGTTVYMVLRGG